LRRGQARQGQGRPGVSRERLRLTVAEAGRWARIASTLSGRPRVRAGQERRDHARHAPRDRHPEFFNKVVRSRATSARRKCARTAALGATVRQVEEMQAQ
jgi:hypothetical protein